LPNKPILFKNSTTLWECFKDTKSNLVYFVHSKCACTFYKQLFSKLNWKKFVSVDIDWNTHVVFSHIRDPLTKHRTGIIEWFYYNNKIDLLYKNSENSTFFTMLSEIAYLDTHSLSIYEHLGENSNLVSWIPIDQPGVDHVQQTFNLIEQQHSIDNTVKQWFKNLPPLNVSTGFKKQCVDKLKELPPTPLIIKSIEHDNWLYDRVTKKNFEPVNYSKRINYLKSLGMTQKDAKSHADHDVETGLFLNWD
jgi:hypothetical protein